MRTFIYLIVVGAALLTLALVVRSGIFMSKNPGEPINSSMRAAMDQTSPQLSERDATEIRRRYPTAYTSADGLMYVNRAPGTGTATPRVGDTVVAQYDGRLLDGTPFDSSYSRGKPFSFRLGTGQVIKGWEEAFLTMKKGGKRTLIIPYWLAYGNEDRPSIPAKSTLVFEVELVDFFN